MRGWWITGSAANSSAIIAAWRVGPCRLPKMQATDSFAACGPGVERVHEEAAALFPGTRIMVLSSDLIATAERMRANCATSSRAVDSIIGTQLVAKGHHFPKLNLFGIVDANLGLSDGDPRLRTDVSIALSGRRPGRPGVGPRPRLPADPSARAPGDAGAHRRRPGSLLCPRDRGPRAHQPSPIRTPRRSRDLGAGPPRDGELRRQFCVAAPADDAVRVLGPAEAPIAVIAGATAFGCWPNRYVASISRPICAAGTPKPLVAGIKRHSRSTMDLVEFFVGTGAIRSGCVSVFCE